MKTEEAGGVLDPGISETLQRFWEDEVGGGDDDPLAEPTNTLRDTIIPIDSLTAVRALARIKTNFGISVPTKFVKRGGYSDCADFVNHLIHAVEKSQGEGKGSTKMNKPKLKHAS